MRKIKPSENDLVPFLLFLLNCVQLFVVHSLSQVWLFVTPWTAARQASLVPHYLPELAQTHVHKSCLQSFPASGSFLMSWLFTSGSQIIGTSVLASVFPMNIQDWFPLGLTGLISLQSKELSRVFSNTTVQKHQFFTTQLSLWSNSHIHTWLLEKP